MKYVWHCILSIALLSAVAIAQDAPKRITRAEAMSAVTTKVQPDYPAIGRQLKMQGSVQLDVTVSEAGEVTKVDVVSGNPVLTAAAVQAVKRWKFKPFQDNGKAIRVVAPILVDFKL